jgi:hypothetical protein
VNYVYDDPKLTIDDATAREVELARSNGNWSPELLSTILRVVCFVAVLFLAGWTLIHGYGEDLDVQAPSYRLEEIIAEKMRSLLQTHKKLVARGCNRPHARDYYDLWRLLTGFNN